MNRRLRGVIGTALTWGTGWAVIGLGVAGLQAVALRASGVRVPMQLERFIALVTIRWAVSGVVAGTLFALALWYVGRRLGSLAALSPRRAAVAGALAGVALPLVVAPLLVVSGVAVPLTVLLPFVVTGAAFGAGTAAGTVALARRAPEPLGAGPDAVLSSPASLNGSLPLEHARDARRESSLGPASREQPHR